MRKLYTFPVSFMEQLLSCLHACCLSLCNEYPYFSTEFFHYNFHSWLNNENNDITVKDICLWRIKKHWVRLTFAKMAFSALFLLNWRVKKYGRHFLLT